MIDKDFTPVELKEIIRAVNEWNRALNKEMTLNVVDISFDMEPSKIEECLKENGIMILKVPSYGTVMHLVDDGTIGAKTDSIGGHVIYLLSDRITDKSVFAFTLHEIGHVLGAEHTEAGLMHPRYSPSKNYCVDKEAINQVASFNGLDAKRLNYCEVK